LGGLLRKMGGKKLTGPICRGVDKRRPRTARTAPQTEKNWGRWGKANEVKERGPSQNSGV